ncbi:SAM-dependent methyltransferase [Kangiella sp. HZ709]|uniref:SAM-dependent methyltransferase n=1 Tax=Kangiella sp. HZ709 TaxID=2666328 RepID=UPI0012AEFB04|nr:SAM-dependent methyltransferase [Kangiella sp. HZ709]MRX27681.1 hypothetical protein [Kangiella sp. HZ709]
MTTDKVSGSLVCVGIGMKLGAHISPISRSYVENADVVFMGVSSGLVELWIQEMNKDVRSLQPFYKEGKSRLTTYKEMVEAMLSEVRKGKSVCGAFYGHPGVFAWAPHKAIEQARKEGYPAHMEPGISAEDCLYADLGIDPGTYGCQHYEATQLILYNKVIDVTSYLIVWQIGVVGDLSLKRFSTDENNLKHFVEVLSAYYEPTQEVTIYRAAVGPTDSYRALKVSLIEMMRIDLTMEDTLVVPPAEAVQRRK